MTMLLATSVAAESWGTSKNVGSMATILKYNFDIQWFLTLPYVRATAIQSVLLSNVPIHSEGTTINYPLSLFISMIDILLILNLLVFLWYYFKVKYSLYSCLMWPYKSTVKSTYMPSLRGFNKLQTFDGRTLNYPCII